MVNEHDTHEEDVEITGNETDTDELLEDDDAVTTEQAARDKLKKLRSQLDAVTKEKQDIHEQLQRAKADHLNARKRLETEKQEGIERAQVRFIENLLPVCDSFRMAMSNHAVWEQVDEQWRKGVEGILSQLNAVLDTYQVQTLNPNDEPFDPHKHEALSEQPVSNEEEVNTVCQVIQPGYEATINGNVHLVRPARVVVGVASELTEPNETNEG